VILAIKQDWICFRTDSEMRIILPLLIPLLLAASLLGCVEEFSANVDPPSPRPLVVDGGVTSGPGPHRVRLSLAAAFEQSLEGNIQRIEGAEVAIVDDSTGRRVELSPAEISGKYRTEEGEFTGVPGHAYHLEVTLPDGRRYRSVPQRMPEPVPMDSVFATFDPSPQPRIRVKAAARDPEGTEQYYRWGNEVLHEYGWSRPSPPFYCWEEGRLGSSQVSILSDRLIDGGRIQQQVVYSIPPSLRASYPSQVDVRQFTITEEAFRFWSKVREQVEEAGNPFSAPPAPIRGNVVSVQDSTDRALGYFQVAGVSQKQTECFKQKDFEDAPAPFPLDNPACPIDRGATFERPEEWVCSPESHKNPPEGGF
jgi:hypothetical protein